jgi:hypothetical protein
VSRSVRSKFDGLAHPHEQVARCTFGAVSAQTKSTTDDGRCLHGATIQPRRDHQRRRLSVATPMPGHQSATAMVRSTADAIPKVGDVWGNGGVETQADREVGRGKVGPGNLAGQPHQGMPRVSSHD